MPGTYAELAVNLGLIAFGAFLAVTIKALLDRREKNDIIAAIEQELIAEAHLNIAKLGGLSNEITKIEQSGSVPVFLPYRMSLATLHQTISTGQLRLLPSNQTQRLWRLVAEACESFSGFVDNTELVATIVLLHTNGAAIALCRCRQLADQAKETKQFIVGLLDKIDPTWKEQNT